MGEQMANSAYAVNSDSVVERLVSLVRQSGGRAGTPGSPLGWTQEGKWKCTSCLEATGVPSRVAG
jgi:hypothetical protein